MTQRDPQSAAGEQPGQFPDQSVSGRTQAEGGVLAEGAKRDLDEVTRQAAADARALKDQAGEQVAAATEKAKSFAGEQKNFLAEQITGIADAVSKVASELSQSDQKVVARYARDVSQGLNNLGKQIQDDDIDQLMGRAQTFGRQQPLAFLGAAALAGFLASRFAMASAQRSAAKDGTASGSGQSQRSDQYGGQG